RRRAFVGERVIDAATGTPLLPLLDERIRSKIRAPLRGRFRFRSGAGLGGGQRGSGRILVEPLGEPERLAVGSEANLRLVGLSLAKLTHAPRVGRVQPLAQ